MKLLCNKKEPFYTKAELLNFKITLSLAKLNMVSLRFLSNGLIFSDDIPVNIQLVNFLLISSISELSIGTKTKKF